MRAAGRVPKRSLVRIQERGPVPGRPWGGLGVGFRVRFPVSVRSEDSSVSGSAGGPGASCSGAGFGSWSEESSVGGSRGGAGREAGFGCGPGRTPRTAARAGQAWGGAGGGGARWWPRVWAPRSCSCARVSARRPQGRPTSGRTPDRAGAPAVSSRAGALGRAGSERL